MPDYSFWIAASLLGIAVVLWKVLPRDRSRIRTAIGFLLLWGAFALFTAAASYWKYQNDVVNEMARTLLILAGIQLGFLLVFDLVLRRVRLPKFASEIGIVGAYTFALFQMLNHLGVNATSLFATSAVATAVLGLALQDMLSNIAGGMSLQLEDSVNAGDFIRCGEYSGWVQHIRLRHTSILTADGDSVILPNSFLTRSSVVILSKSHRHFVPFQMPYSHHPHEVIDAVEVALHSSPLAGIAHEPKPKCLVQEMTPGHIVYAAVVWLTNPGLAPESVSPVLSRIYYALDRAGMPAGDIAYLVENKAPAPPAEETRPDDILTRIPIFRLLESKDIADLAGKLRRLSFAPGEHILRQGDPGDSMYFVLAGRVNISYRSPDGAEKDLATFETGDFFGEASLLTGETRTATATAMTHVTCYRLDKAGLQHTMEQQPDLAEDMSVIMAHRQFELSAAREKMDRETALRRESESQTQMLARIRRFFGITKSASV